MNSSITSRLWFHDAIDAEIQVRTIELEKFAQQFLELLKVRLAVGGVSCHDAIFLYGGNCIPLRMDITLHS